MDEFLDKLQEDQRRMRKFLRSKAERFKTMGEALAAPAAQGTGRVHLVAEAPLDALLDVVGREYLLHLPVEIGADLEATAEGVEEEDVVLAFLHEGKQKAIRRVLERARAREATILVIGGLGSKTRTTKRQASVMLTLPTRGIKTIVESIFISARILARISRGFANAAPDQTPAEERPPSSRIGSALVEERGSEKIAKRKKKSRRLKPSVLEIQAIREEDLEDSQRDEGAEAASEATSKKRATKSKAPAAAKASESKPKSGSKDRTGSRPKSGSKPQGKSGSRPRSSSKSRPEASEAELPTAPPLPQPAPALDPFAADDAPVGLVSHEDPAAAGPTFGSDIIVGSDVLPVTDAPVSSSKGVDPFSLDDDFLSDLQMPAQSGGASGSAPQSSDSTPDGRMVSARFSIQDCKIRWGRGGFPDETSPPHRLLQLTRGEATFQIANDDEAAATLHIEDELWVRIEIPAFIDPILARGRLRDLSGAVGNGGTTAHLDFLDLDDALRRKLDRAAETLRAPA